MKKVKKIYKNIKKDIKGRIPAQYWRVFARWESAFGRSVAKARVIFIKIKERLPLKALRIAFCGLEYIGIVFLLVVVFIGFSPRFDFPGGFKSLVVLSGSMEPAIKTGSVVVVQPRESYAVNDVVTISKKLGAVDHVTHRIVGMEEGKIVTKGDANDAPDNWELTKGNIEGKVIFSAPYLGYAVNFSRSVRGFMLLVVLPAVLIVLSEFWEIKKEIEKSYEKKLKKALGDVASGAKKMKIALLFLVFGFSVLAFSSGATVAALSDSETILASITVGTWDEEDVSPDVVINEVMWMGSTGDDDDEWLELKNTTGETIDLAGWTIAGAGSGSSAITISSGVIPAGGYFLISHYASDSSAISNGITVDSVIPGISLVNGGEVLTLKDATNNVVDATPAGAWEDGNNKNDPVGQRNSMERNDSPGTGTAWSDWHTCLADGCHTMTFWDSEGTDYGTPKAANLSEGDPTSLDELRGAGSASDDAADVEEEMEAEGGEKAGGGVDSAVDVVVEPEETGEGQEGSTGDGGSDADGSGVEVVEENAVNSGEEVVAGEGQEGADMGTGGDEDNSDTGSGDSDGDNGVIWLGDEDNGVVDIGVTGGGDDPASPDELGGAGDGDGGSGGSGSGSGETESNE